MMGGPFDLTALMRDLIGTTGLQGSIMRDAQNSVLQQEQARQSIAANSLELQSMQQKAAKAREFDADAALFASDPTAERLLALTAKYPEQYRPLKAGYDAMDEKARTSRLRFYGTIHSALNNGRPDLAIKHIEDIRNAELSSGIASPSDLDEWITNLRSGDKGTINTVKAQALVQMAAATGTDKFAQTHNVVGKSNDYTLSPGQQRRDGQTDEVVASAPQTPRVITSRPGTSVYLYQPGADGASGELTPLGGNGSGDAPAGAGGGSAAEALRTNEGAIKDGPWARRQPGYDGSAGGFAKFKTVEQGRSAQARLLKENYLGKGFDTPRKIVERYAPRGPENSDASVNNYIAHVARRLGIGADDVIPSGKAAQLAQAIREFETGQRPAGRPTLTAPVRKIVDGGPAPSWRQLSPAEVARRGLDPSQGWQVSPQGRVSRITTPAKPKAGGKQTPSDVFGPLLAKVARGEPLTPAEAQALSYYRRGGGKGGAAGGAGGGKYREGQTATGPNGQKLSYRGGKWVPNK